MNERTNGKTEIENGSECVRGERRRKAKRGKKTTSQDHSRAMHGAKH